MTRINKRRVKNEVTQVLKNIQALDDAVRRQLDMDVYVERTVRSGRDPRKYFDMVIEPKIDQIARDRGIDEKGSEYQRYLEDRLENFVDRCRRMSR